MRIKLRKISAYLAFGLNLILIVIFWYQQSGSLLFLNPAGIFISLGRLAGLLATYFVLWELLLIGRGNWLEQTFGLDRLALAHHLNGFLALFFILLHPIFLVLGYGARSGRTFFAQMINFILKWEGMVPATLAVLVFLLVIIFSILTIKKKLKYETWFFIHIGVYLAIIWSFGHQLEVGFDLQNIFIAAYWSVLFYGVIFYFIITRFLKPAYYFYRHRFVVDRVVKETLGVVSIYITGRDLKYFKVKAGQWFIVRFLDKSWYEAHPFSLSCAPNENYLRFTIKALGDFTINLENKIKPGTSVILDGPNGVFTADRAKNNKLALVAGGIGISPIWSLIESLNASQKNMILFCANRRVDDIVFNPSLSESIKNNPNLKTCQVLNGEVKDGFESGYVDSEKIKRLAPDYLERDWFVCGPPLMMKALIKTLKDLGVKASAIHFEKFSF